MCGLEDRVNGEQPASIPQAVLRGTIKKKEMMSYTGLFGCVKYSA